MAAGRGCISGRYRQGETRPIRGTEGNLNIGEPVFSPDGQSIVFAALADQTLKRVPISGGTPVTVCQAGYAYGLTWASDGILFVERNKGIMRVDPCRHTHRAGPPNAGEAVQRPQTLPGGQHLLFTLAAGTVPIDGTGPGSSSSR